MVCNEMLSNEMLCGGFEVVLLTGSQDATLSHLRLRCSQFNKNAVEWRKLNLLSVAFLKYSN